MSDLDTKAIEARLAAATPGPWVSNWSQPSGDERCEHILAANGDEVVGALWYDGPHLSVNERDADLIAHAPADIAALLAEVAALREALTVTPERIEAAGIAFDTGIGSVAERLRAALLAAGMREPISPEDVNRKEPPMPNACTE